MIDLDNMTQEQWNEGVGKATPGAPTTTTAPPTTTTPAAEPIRETTPAPVQAETQPADTRPRNPDGTFAPQARGDAPATTEAAPRLPFDGFDKLDPAAQAQFNRLLGERDDFKLRYTRLNGEYRRVAQRQNGSGRESQPVQQQPRSGATQVGQAAQDARQGTQALQPGPQREALQRQIDAWEKHAHDYPDDAKAIEQRLGKLADDMAQGLAGPLLQEINGLRGQLEELRGGYQTMLDERAERISHEHQQTLDQVAGDNWRQIAGWEDENGNPIPREQWDWHPEFQAWVNGHDPDEANEMWDRLSNKSPRVVGSLIAAFNRERFGLDGPSDGTPRNGQATPADTQGQRRADNLRDIAPGARGTAKPSGAPVWEPSGSEYVDAVRSPAYQAWRNA